MAPIRLTHRARADLAEIGRYIARDNPPRARTFLMDIHRTADAYADHPDMGRDRADLGKGVRSFPHGDYVVFYRRYRSGIQIVRVLSGYRDVGPGMFES